MKTLRTLTPSGAIYSVESAEGERVQVPFPIAGSEAEPAIRVLEALWAEERLQERPSAEWLLPLDEVYALEEAEASSLGIPVPREVLVELRTRMYAGAPDFRILPISSTPEEGILPPEARIGPWFDLRAGIVLVRREVAELFRLLDADMPAAVDEALVRVGEIKRAAAACGARLDSYLETQDIHTPQALDLEVEADGADRLRIRPTLRGLPPGEFPRLARGEIPAVDTEIRGSNRRRVVVPRVQREAAHAMRQVGELRGADVPRFLSNPEAFLPDEIDLSLYSLRVRGIVPRRYNSQPYVRLQPAEKRGWFEYDVRVDLAEEVFGPSSEYATAAGEADAASGSNGPKAAADPMAYEQRNGVVAAPPHLTPTAYAELCRRVVETGEPFQQVNGDWLEIDPETANQYLRAWDAGEAEGERRLISRERVAYILDVISNLDELEFDQDLAPEPIPDLPEYPVPDSLNAELRPHQQIGYRWMRYLHQQRFGGLLADDMGLGKTVQVIGLMAHLAEKEELQPALIVLPLTLIENWRRELARFCPRIRRVYVHQGPDRLRTPEALGSWEIVLTSYETLRRDQLVLGQVDWSVIACDEAQKVKNPTAQATSAVKGMKAGLRLALTGTPVENGLSELWCIVDWAQPGKLGSQREFRRSYERPMQSADAGDRVLLANRLQRQLTPHYLRRTKSEIASELPPRHDDVVRPVCLGERQEQYYGLVMKQVHEGGMIAIEALNHLIALASHPELFEPSGAPVEELIDECPKLQVALELLAAIREKGEKAVVFTRFRLMQQILQDAVRMRFDVHAAVLNGEVAGGRRQDLVDRFNAGDGFGVLLLSPEAAGVGLNIVGANHVIHYSRLWNPAKENQATDRVHRMGQTRPVTVYYPIVQGRGGRRSVEEHLHQLLEEKRALARDVVRTKEGLSVDRELMDAVFGDELPPRAEYGHGESP
jgi:hypothetical protein